MHTPSELAAALTKAATNRTTTSGIVQAVLEGIANAMAAQHMTASGKGPLSSSPDIVRYLTETDPLRRATYPAEIRWFVLLHETATHLNQEIPS